MASTTFTKNQSALANLNALIDELNDTEKSAAAKSSGTGGRKSSHPTAKLDGGVQPMTTGSHYADNTAAINKMLPNVGAVGSGRTSNKADHSQPQIGTHKSMIGEDPAVEDNYVGRPDDPGTSSPANADDLGEKYASMAFEDLYRSVADDMEELCARLAAGEKYTQKSAAEQLTPEQAAAAGFAVADQAQRASQEDGVAMLKAASVEFVADLQKIGYARADLVYDYRTKKAAYAAELANSKNASQAGPPPGHPAEESHAGGEPVPSELPPEQMGGGDANGPGASGSHEEIINELLNAMMEAGISPEELLAHMQGGPAGEPAPETKAASAEQKLSTADRDHFVKMASAAIYHRKSGRFRAVAPKNETEKKARSAKVASFTYLKEILGS